MLLPKHLILIFIILIGSDILIGVIGHYTGSTDTGEEFNFDNFMEYITSQKTRNELLIVISIAILVVVLIHYIAKF